MQTGPEQKDHVTTRFPGRVRSLRTQQRAYNRFPAPTPFHTPRLRRDTGPYWGQPQLPAELVSVPPSSTTPDACSPSRLTGHRDLGAALDHQTSLAASAP